MRESDEMRGLDLSLAFWNEFGRPTIQREMPEAMKYIAVGLVGAGSECYGFDDNISHDHDFEQGFCIFLPSEEVFSRRDEFLLERLYSRLPKEFMGYTRLNMNPAGGGRHGVIRTSEFYTNMTGLSGKPDCWQDWLSVPEYALYEVTNGKVFYDAYGEFSNLRRAWQTPPEDIRLKKLSGRLLAMNQSGEYNYVRCKRRGDEEAARLAGYEFVRSCIGAVMWINNRPVPYYKWMFRAMRELEGGAEIADILGRILSENDAEADIAKACCAVLSLLGEYDDIQEASFGINGRIADTELRNIPPLF